jgi:CheY-like chemotaxis protein
MERAFSKCNIPNPLRIVNDGKQAMAYLAGTSPFESRDDHPLPCLMLMDLSMPGRHGLDVLAWIKTQSGLTTLPVVIFSSSSQESDIVRGYALGADGFMVKPGDPQDLQSLVTCPTILAQRQPPSRNLRRIRPPQHRAPAQSRVAVTRCV